jgi:uncharacterized damage-inducible protein DinB
MTTVDLVRYNHAVRELYLDALSRLTWAEVVSFKGLSFDSARNVFLHLTLVEDRWINYIIPNRFSEWKDPDFDAYKNIDALKRYANSTKVNTEKFLSNLKAEDWNQKVTLPWPNYKPNTQVTVETVLNHMVLENMIHYGELSALLWQLNQEAPYLSYCRYKFNSENKL